ncbi:MAG: hypothetical protein JO033_05615 [Acidobacteriaceae bacterium]|nr:hypothetical protein [Acidobacteriaceae bacterium]MBV9501739.1 hypothetical protein [Acidobacteriaceae bacterium]
MRNFAMAVAALLTPAALLGFTITIWSLGAGQHWTAAFFISSGPFAHWQTWLVASLALFVLAVILNRFAASREHYSG